jgi:hypothetical protein
MRFKMMLNVKEFKSTFALVRVEKMIARRFDGMIEWLITLS